MTKTDKEGQRKTPILRFKGFTDDWEQRKLGEIFKFSQGLQVPIDQQFEKKEENTERFIRIVDVTQDNIPQRFVYNPTGKGRVNLDDIFFVRYGAVGTIGHGFKGVIANNLFKVIPLIDINPLFWFYQFSDIRFNSRLKALSASTSMPAINFNTLRKMIISNTSIVEQNKIGTILKSLDNLLTLYDRKLKLLSQVKKYFLDNLFAEKEYPNLRFKYFKKDKWEKTSLNSIVTYSNGKAHEKEINNKGNLDLVMMNSITTGGRLITKKKILSPQDTLNKNDIVIVLSDIAKGELIGKSSVIPCDNQYVLNQRIGCLHPTLNIDSFFVSKYINQKNRYFKSHAAGTSQINLSRSDVLNCTIYIPKVDEQHCVSNFIINVEKIINFYEYKKRHIIQIKNILLNTMFI